MIRVVGILGVSMLALSLFSAIATAASARVDRGWDDRFYIDFDTPMQVMTNQVDEGVVTLDPALSVSCSWASDARMQCRTHGDLQPATAYTVRVAALRSLDGDQVVPASQLHFETARPRVDVRVQDWEDGIPILEVTASIEPRPGSLAEHLGVEFEGRPVSFTLSERKPTYWSGETTARYELRLDRMPKRNGMLKVYMRAGLRGRIGHLPGLQSGSVAHVALRLRPELEGVTCGPRHAPVQVSRSGQHIAVRCTPYDPIRLWFGAKIDDDARDNLIEGFRTAAGTAFEGSMERSHDPLQGSAFSPFLPEGTRAAPSHWIELGALAPHRSVTARLDRKYLFSGGLRFGSVKLHVQSEAPTPQLTAKSPRMLLGRRGSGEGLLTLQGDRPLSLDVDSLAAVEERENIQLRPNGARKSVLNASPLLRNSLDGGGWLRLKPQGPGRSMGSYYSISNEVDIAAPDFDLYVAAGRRHVLAWANAWDGSGPVVGATVELLMRESASQPFTAVAEGVTESDGTVLIRVPESLQIDLPQEDLAPDRARAEWVARASSSSAARVQRAVLPIGPSDDRAPIGAARFVHAWGVSDRSMYRAGDVVRYQIWQREFVGNEMKPVGGGPVTLQLWQDDKEKVIIDWEEQAQPGGTIASSRRLPVHLTDGTYCIGIPYRGQTSGACFFVGAFNPQDLWLEAEAQGTPTVLRDDEPWSIKVSAGYFSGGNAAGVELTLSDAMLYPMAIEEAYPEFAEFSFADVYADGISEPALLEPEMPSELDTEGRASIRGRVAFKGDPELLAARPAFGLLAMSIEATPEGRESSFAYVEDLRYARFERYVGLKTTPDWFDADSEIEAETVVIDAFGQRVEDPPVEVKVEFVGNTYFATAVQVIDPVLITTCTLRSGQRKPCNFERKRSGRYRLTATSGKAAPAVIERYLRVRGDERWTAEETFESELEFIEERLDEPGRPLRFRLTQQHDSATALILFVRGDELLERHVVEISQPVQELALPSALPRGVRYEVRALVRSTAPSKFEHGLRVPPEVEVIWGQIPERPAQDPAPSSVRVAFEARSAAPADEVVVVLSNHGSQAREVALSVTDDALRTQAQRWLPYADPKGPLWLSGPWTAGNGELRLTGFDQWRGGAWTWLIGSPASAQATASLMSNTEYAPPADYAGDDPDSSSLDRIEVTGSRISRADIVEAVDVRAPDDIAARAQRPDTRSKSAPLPKAARLRTQFEDTALWMSGIRLQPGEQRRIALRLPHNLTRWRAIAWSADSGKGFEMTEATIEAGLPLELRVQAPARMYPGDVVDIATHLRQNGSQPLPVEVAVVAAGAGADASLHTDVNLDPKGQKAVRLRLAPDQPGALSLRADASSVIGGDAVGASLEVASRQMRTALLQAGWIATAPRALALPSLPDDANGAELEVSIFRPDRLLTRQWTAMLKDYPHRCWEQILSRAVGAAVALRGGSIEWDSASEVVNEALDNAAVFQSYTGAFSFFADSSPPEDLGASVELTAWTVRALGWLSEQGFDVPGHVVNAAEGYLNDVLPSDRPNARDITTVRNVAATAFAAAALKEPPREVVDALWRSWHSAPQPVQVAILRGMASIEHESLDVAVERMLDSAPERAGVRRLALSSSDDSWLSSNLREHCALVGLVHEHAEWVSAETALQLRRGLLDLYSEAATGIDTQAAAECLISIGDTIKPATDPVAVTLQVGDRRLPLRLDADADRASWKADALSEDALSIESPEHADALAFIAELRFDEDMKTADAKAIGLALTRRYDVLEQGAWKPTGTQPLTEGDWVRVTLEVDSAALRRHLALTDQLPGGLQPVDLSLSNVASSDLLRVADEGSGYFGTRRLDARSPKFYAEMLPPGTHAVHYFARVAHPGRFLAPPATAELMYGSIGRARTPSTQFEILASTTGE